MDSRSRNRGSWTAAKQAHLDRVLEVLEEFAGTPFSHFKAVLTELSVATLGPIGAEMKRLVADPGYVDDVLKEGAERAQARAQPILEEVHDTIGFLRN